jgi:uncharacterized membrane protein YfcA
MSPFIILSVSIGYAVESMFGFGGSIITYLIATQFVPPKEIIAMLPVFALTGSLLVLVTDKGSASWKFIFSILIYAVPGLVVGALVMAYTPERLLSIAILIMIFLYSIFLVAGRNPAFPLWSRKPLYVISGFIIGATSLGVIFIMVLSSQLENQRSFRSSLALLWTMLAIARVPMYAISGILTRSAAMSSLISLPFVFISIMIGFKVHKCIPEAHYKRYVGAVLAAAALLNILRYL